MAGPTGALRVNWALTGRRWVGFVLVAGFEGFLFLSGEVFAIIRAPRAAEYAVTIFHFSIHVVSMNQPGPPALGVYGRFLRNCAGTPPSLKIPLKLVHFPLFVIRNSLPLKRQNLEARVGIDRNPPSTSHSKSSV